MRNTILILSLGAFALWLTTGKKTAPEEKSDALAPAVQTRQPAAAQVAAAQSVAKPTTSPDEKAKRLAELDRLEKCIESHLCDFPETDPHSYEFAVGKEQARQLKEFRERYGKDASAQGDLERLGRRFIHNSDGFVKSEALAILSGLPTSTENLTALSEGLSDSPDAPLLKEALPELQRYLGTGSESQVHTLLSSLMQTGGHFVAQAAAENIYPFINSSSYGIYSQSLSQIPSTTKVSSDLGAALREYEKLQTGA